MVVGFTTTYAISVYHHYSCEFEFTHGDVNSIQYDVKNFVSDLRNTSNIILLNHAFDFSVELYFCVGKGGFFISTLIQFYV
jgi:hypothetical protein